jgi:hypothetical protein
VHRLAGSARRSLLAGPHPFRRGAQALHFGSAILSTTA